jgi:hypothetical protein
MIANMPEKTGKSLEQWVGIAKKCGEAKHGAIVSFLKSQHALGHGYANLVAQRTLSADAPAGDEDLVSAQYAGARAGLKPIHDAIVAAAKKLGSDVEISPKKTGVSLRRARQFVLIQPATNTRIDLGLKLDDVPLGGRLEKWPNTMCTHRVRLETLKDVDRELLGWIRKAYEQAD